AAWQRRSASGSGVHTSRRVARSPEDSPQSKWPMSATSRGSSPPDVGVIIPAGGAGERAGPGGPKQFRPVAGVPLLLRALRPFTSHAAVREIVIALPEADYAHPPSWLSALTGETLRLVPGGATRAASVASGLHALSPVSA